MTTPTRDDYDSPWKEALERYFPEFLALLYPKIHAEIDWTRGPEFLDKELQQVVRDAELGRRYADKLAKVYTRDGAETWVLIHVEVQGEPEARFAERMYTYHYRLFDRYTERAWVFRKAGCVPCALGQGAPTRRSGHYGEEAQRRPSVRGACNAAKNPRVLGILGRHRQPRRSRRCAPELSPCRLPAKPLGLRAHLPVPCAEAARLARALGRARGQPQPLRPGGDGTSQGTGVPRRANPQGLEAASRAPPLRARLYS